MLSGENEALIDASGILAAYIPSWRRATVATRIKSPPPCQQVSEFSRRLLTSQDYIWRLSQYFDFSFLIPPLPTRAWWRTGTLLARNSNQRSHTLALFVPCASLCQALKLFWGTNGSRLKKPSPLRFRSKRRLSVEKVPSEPVFRPPAVSVRLHHDFGYEHKGPV